MINFQKFDELFNIGHIFSPNFPLALKTINALYAFKNLSFFNGKIN